MKLPILLLSIILWSETAICQDIAFRGEFATNSNGLMYSDTSMKILRLLVDSLNLRFKTCDMSRPFYACPQGKVWKLSFSSETDNLQALKKDLDANIKPGDLLVKYKTIVKSIDTNSIAICYNDEDDDKDTYYLTGKPQSGYEHDYVLGKEALSALAGKWIYDYSPKEKYQKYYKIECRYVPEPLVRKNIPDEYGKYIQYVDCMVDTSTVVFLTNERNYNWLDETASKNSQRVLEYIDQKMGATGKNKKKSEGYLTEEKIEYAKQNLTRDSAFRKLVVALADDCIADNKGSDASEELVAAIVSKRKALEMKRHRRVVGMCSQDQSPRMHARDIAILAAESHSWDVFLRAHLDIMNDRFERMSDGSYAWGRRQTYLKELEELNLDVVDLMLGPTLRAANVSSKHYYGTVWRIGKSLAESKDQQLFEEKALLMMKDNRLDEFNRGLIFLLYNSYLNSLRDTGTANTKIAYLKNDASQYPFFLQSAISGLEKREKKAEEE
ncbi:MAG: hypothetical protein QM731_13255 [Chitinophagaceae bacterium]